MEKRCGKKKNRIDLAGKKKSSYKKEKGARIDNDAHLAHLPIVIKSLTSIFNVGV